MIFRISHHLFRGAVTAGLLVVTIQANGAPKPAATASPSSMVDAVSDRVALLLDEYTDAHYHKGEYNHVINLYRIVLAGRPDHLEAYANAAWLLWSMDRDSEALALYDRGVRANPKTFFMYDEMGQYYYSRKRNYPQAVKYYEMAARCKDVQPLTIHQLAHAYEKSGNIESAFKTWQRAVKDKSQLVPAARRNLERVRRMLDGKQPGNQ